MTKRLSAEEKARRKRERENRRLEKKSLKGLHSHVRKTERKAAQAKARRTRRKFSKTPVGRLARGVYQQARTGNQRKIKRALRELMDPGTMRAIERAGSVERYALEKTVKAALNRLWKALGPIGATIKVQFEDKQRSGGRALENQIEAAIDFLEAFGYDVSQAPPIQAAQGDPGAEDAIRLVDEVIPELEAMAEEIPYATELDVVEDIDEHLIDTRLVQRPTGGFTEEAEGLTEEIETPESSNVFSIQYDAFFGILYVTFKAGGEAIGTKKAVNSCKPGSKPYSIGIRAHRRGPTYAYGGKNTPIPEQVWDSFVRATSKGQFVWNELRICGTIHGHQYPYRLVQGDAYNDNYVPRKATAKGFRRRALVSTGRGARPAAFSTLPERLFGTPDRGQPNTGAPNTGAP